MHWYKRDPDAALAGMAELTFEECGAYNRILDILYSRDGDVPNDDVKLARIMHCQPRTWVRLKKRLIQFGKVWVTAEGKLMAKRVEKTMYEANKLSVDQSEKASKKAELFRLSNKINGASMPRGNASTTTTTTTIRGVRDLGRQEGFKALPASKEFIAWVAYAFEKNIPLWRELQRREQEGRGFDFATQWPPEKAAV